MKNNQKFTKAFSDAIAMLEMLEDLEPRSALKQCASDSGISEGKELEAFVLWAESKMYSEEV
jgi:hypothetical protein|tara:strand:- start:884 stop:1069 length:186 start_codon:yes stop_codon:yes gene_type:complete